MSASKPVDRPVKIRAPFGATPTLVAKIFTVV